MIMSSYDLAERYHIPHSELCIRISNLANEMDSEIMQFQKIDKEFWLLNTFASAMIILLIGYEEED